MALNIFFWSHGVVFFQAWKMWSWVLLMNLNNLVFPLLYNLLGIIKFSLMLQLTNSYQACVSLCHCVQENGKCPPQVKWPRTFRGQHPARTVSKLVPLTSRIPAERWPRAGLGDIGSHSASCCISWALHTPTFPSISSLLTQTSRCCCWRPSSTLHWTC